MLKNLLPETEKLQYFWDSVTSRLCVTSALEVILIKHFKNLLKFVLNEGMLQIINHVTGPCLEYLWQQLNDQITSQLSNN
jgi:hypothetical protein